MHFAAHLGHAYTIEFLVDNYNADPGILSKARTIIARIVTICYIYNTPASAI